MVVTITSLMMVVTITSLAIILSAGQGEISGTTVQLEGRNLITTSGNCPAGQRALGNGKCLLVY